MSNELEFNLRQAAEIMQKRPESVFSNLRGVSAEFGMHRKEEFVRSLDRSLAKRKRPIVLAILGESVSSKTTVARDIVAEVFGYGDRKITKTSKLIEQKGEIIPVEGIFWGEILTLTKSLGLTENPDARFGEFTVNDNREGTKVFAQEIAQSVKENQGKRRLILAEGVGVTGMPWLKKNPKSDLTEVEPFEYDRGVVAYWDLSAKKGEFKGLDYDVYWLGVVADPAIREMGKKVRANLGNVVADPEKAVKALKEAGIKFDSNKVNEVIEWAHSSASEVSIKKMEEQTNNLIIKIATLGAFQIFMDFKDRPDYRAEIIGTLLIPYILRSIGVKKHIFIANNYKPLEEMYFNTSVPIENTIIRRHPEVARIPNKR